MSSTQWDQEMGGRIKDKPHPDATTWLASYEEEYNGLVSHDTFNVLSKMEYQAL
jgi:hypothetical protein